MGNRVSAHDEVQGLDLPEMGVPGYPEFSLRDGHVGSFVFIPTEKLASPASVAIPSPQREPM